MKKQNTLKALIAMVLLLVAGTTVFGNNIRVNINSYDAVTKKLNVTLAWDNSWHDGTGTFRDAAWIFVKYKDVTMSEWAPAPMNTPTAAQIQATGNGIRFEILPKNLQTGGYRGWMVRRAKVTGLQATDTTMTGVNNVSMTFDIPFLFSGIPASPEFKVFALEMVDIPKGAFYAGDMQSYNTLGGTKSYGVTSTKVITNEGATTIYANNTALGATTTLVPAVFPKGFDEFYIMKYELSMEGYAEFLNSLTRTQQNNLVQSNTLSGLGNGSEANVLMHMRAVSTGLNAPAVFSSDLNGNGIGNESNDGQWRGARVGRGRFVLAYLDWAGLRPMSELEFEKASRGTGIPIANEKVWGGGSFGTLVAGDPDIDLGGPNESYSTTFINGINSAQNLRCGVFAKSIGSTRASSGGSYYGVMDLGNNSHELVKNIFSDFSATPAVSTFAQDLGDGVISITAEANVPNWGATAFTKSTAIISYRSGADVYNEDLGGLGVRGVIK